MKQKLENIWYYYKTIIIIAVVVLAAVIYVSVQNRSIEKADCDVAIVSPAYYRDEDLAALKGALAQRYGSVSLHHYRIELGAENQDYLQFCSLDADLVGKMSSVFLLYDMDAFRAATSDIPLSDPVPVSDFDDLRGLGFDDLLLTTRTDC